MCDFPHAYRTRYCRLSFRLRTLDSIHACGSVLSIHALLASDSPLADQSTASNSPLIREVLVFMHVALLFRSHVQLNDSPIHVCVSVLSIPCTCTCTGSDSLLIREIFAVRLTRTGSLAASLRQSRPRQEESPFSSFNMKTSRRMNNVR